MIGFVPVRCPATAGPELEILASPDVCHCFLSKASLPINANQFESPRIPLSFEISGQDLIKS